QAVDLRKRPQRDDVVVAVMHGVRISRGVLGVFEIGFVQNDQDPLGNVLVEGVKLVLGKYSAGGVVGIREIYNLGAVRDGLSQSREIVMPVVIRHGAVGGAARFRQHLEADESRFGGEDFILVAQKRSNDIRDDAFRTAAGDDVFDLEFETLGQDAAQIEPAVGVIIETVEAAANSLEC